MTKLRIIALLCVLCTLVTLCPIHASAAGVEITELDSALLRDNRVVDNALVNRSLRLAGQAYAGESSMAGELAAMGFSVLKQDYETCEPGDHHAAYTLGKKELSSGGKTYYAYILVVRGTIASAAEWLSNFTVQDGQTVHSGFRMAAEPILNALEEKITTPADQNILWITGHSRGAAVANHVAAVMMQSGSKYVDPSAVHAYTFACPNVTTKPDQTLNIYNFNYKEDLVPQVPLIAWGFGQNGKIHSTNLSSYVSGSYWSEAEMLRRVDEAAKAVPSVRGYEVIYNYLLEHCYDRFFSMTGNLAEKKHLPAIADLTLLLLELSVVLPAVSLIEETGANIYGLLALAVKFEKNAEFYSDSLVAAHEPSSYTYWISKAYPTNYVVLNKEFKISKKEAAVYRDGPHSDFAVAGRLGYGAPVEVLYALGGTEGQVWYRLGGAYEGYYINSEYLVEASALPDSTLYVDVSLQRADMLQGGTNQLIGLIDSNYALSELSATLDGKPYAEFGTLNTRLRAADSALNQNIDFSELEIGDHTIVITAKDTTGNTASKSLSLTVVDPETITPTCEVSGLIGRKLVTLHCSAPGAVIYYTTDGRQPTASDTRYLSAGIKLYQTATVKAVAVKDGAYSGMMVQNVTVKQPANHPAGRIPPELRGRLTVPAAPGANGVCSFEAYSLQ